MIRHLFLLVFTSFTLSTHAQDSIRTTVFKKDGLYGLRGPNEQILVQANYEYLGWSDKEERPIEGVIGYYNGHWGLLSTKGKKLTKPVYYDLRPVTSDIILSGVKGKFSNRIFYGLLNSRGKVILGSKYTKVQPINDAFIVSEVTPKGKRYGLLDGALKFLLPAEYLDVKPFNDHIFLFKNSKSKYGLIDISGKTLMSASVDSIGSLKNGFAVVHHSGAKGLIDSDGKVVIESKYRDIINLPESGRKLEEFSKWSILTKSNTLLTMIECDSIVAYDGYYMVHRNGHLQILNEDFELLHEGSQLKVNQVRDGKIVIERENKWGVVSGLDEFLPFEYDSIYYDAGYYYTIDDKGWSVINKFGRRITSRKYESLKFESEGLIAVQKNGYWGFIDFQGDEVIPRKYDMVDPFIQRAARVRFLDSYGTINHFGEWICEPVYDTLDITEFGLTRALINSRTDVLNSDGNVTFQTFNELKLHKSGFIEETAEGTQGLVSEYGVLLLYPSYREVSDLIKDSLIVVKSDNQVGAINTSGRWVIPFSSEYEKIIGLNDGYISIGKDGLYGFVDMRGLLRVANRYDSVKLFHEGMAAVKLRNTWGYIDLREKLAVQPLYSFVGDFQNGNAIVAEKLNFGVINKTGEEEISLQFDGIERLGSHYFKVHKDGKLGLYKDRGVRIASPKFTHVTMTEEGYFMVMLRGKYGLLDDTGLFSISQIYDHMFYAGNDIYFCIEDGTNVRIELEN